MHDALTGTLNYTNEVDAIEWGHTDVKILLYLHNVVQFIIVNLILK